MAAGRTTLVLVRGPVGVTEADDPAHPDERRERRDELGGGERRGS